MTLSTLRIPDTSKLLPRITVLGVGGAGCNAVNNMIAKDLKGADFIVANTDAQSLASSSADVKIQLGLETTKGLGAGSDPEVGLKAAQESIDEIMEHLEGSHMCFVTAGMGGGTGTGAMPLIAKTARDKGILTVGVVTKPFFFEGSRRMLLAEEGVEKLQESLHTLIVIPNQNLFQMANEQTTTTEAFVRADEVLFHGVRGVTDLMIRPGLINLDFADVRSIMLQMGKAVIGCGEAEGEDRGRKAAEMAMNNPLLEDTCLKGAKGVLINVIGGPDQTLFDLSDACDKVREGLNGEATVIVGSSLVPDLDGKIRVTVVATGLDATKRSLQFPAVRQAEMDPASISDEEFRESIGDDGSVLEDDPIFARDAWQEQEQRNLNGAEDESELSPDDAAVARMAEDRNPILDDSESSPELHSFVAPRVVTETPDNSNGQDPVVDQQPDKSSGGGMRTLRGLIRNMTGHSDESANGRRPSIRPNLSTHAGSAPEGSKSRSDDDERSIPAFMRRQAN